MGVNRSTANTETLSDITLTVSPNEFETSAGYVSAVTGAVGVNTPDPTDGTFEISDVAVRNIGAGNPRGNLNTTMWSVYGTPGYGTPQFYREGSRVYIDGLLELNAGEVYLFGTRPTIFTLPAGFRPLKNERFRITCWVSRVNALVTGALEQWTSASCLIESDGEVKLEGASANSSGAQMQGTIGSDGFYRSGSISGDWSGNYISFSGVNFRCTD